MRSSLGNIEVFGFASSGKMLLGGAEKIWAEPCLDDDVDDDVGDCCVLVEGLMSPFKAVFPVGLVVSATTSSSFGFFPSGPSYYKNDKHYILDS